ncbi:hypothetical protein [Clostridium sp. D33t1_170424_F3]|uniref:hypothetical protein n=1 Tax=Clostridium sp. D33t1_170424_F3 TaxID=2787099 RepID=UPI0018AA0909|nr:hypothetical protein [Clostridium sp. D33t1_170424_F3]
MDWLRRFMMDRYGTDQLGIALMVFYLFLILLASLTGAWILRLLALAVLILCLFRILSRNRSKRYQENLQFMQVWTPVKAWFQGLTQRAKDARTHKYYHCPKCKNTLRVPRGKGKIQITCPVCRTEFIKKT